MNEREKKRLYNRRILEVEHASFTPLIITTYGAVGIECRTFVSKFSELLAIKRFTEINRDVMGENEN